MNKTSTEPQKEKEKVPEIKLVPEKIIEKEKRNKKMKFVTSLPRDLETC